MQDQRRIILVYKSRFEESLHRTLPNGAAGSDATNLAG